MLHCTWMVSWIANDTRLFRTNCFPTDRVISNWNRCNHIQWPIHLLHWNMDQKTDIRCYIKCRIRLNIDSKQIFNELCGIYGPQTISMRTSNIQNYYIIFSWQFKHYSVFHFSLFLYIGLYIYLCMFQAVKELQSYSQTDYWRMDTVIKGHSS